VGECGDSSVKEQEVRSQYPKQPLVNEGKEKFVVLIDNSRLSVYIHVVMV
jgi:hypothetical protein